MPAESRFSQQFMARREGQVTIKLKVTAKQQQLDQKLQQIASNTVSDEAHIKVRQDLCVGVCLRYTD